MIEQLGAHSHFDMCSLYVDLHCNVSSAMATSIAVAIAFGMSAVISVPDLPKIESIAGRPFRRRSGQIGGRVGGRRLRGWRVAKVGGQHGGCEGGGGFLDDSEVGRKRVLREVRLTRYRYSSHA